MPDLPHAGILLALYLVAAGALLVITRRLCERQSLRRLFDEATKSMVLNIADIEAAGGGSRYIDPPTMLSPSHPIDDWIPLGRHDGFDPLDTLRSAFIDQRGSLRARGWHASLELHRRDRVALLTLTPTTQELS